MTNLNQIEDEIQQQITALTSSIADKESAILELQEELPSLQAQLAGLIELKERTDELKAQLASNTANINLNVNVNAQGASGGGVVNHSVT